jgi:hypothetical protein
MLSLKAARNLARRHGFASLITKPTDNSKLAKAVGYYNAGITLAQGKLSGHNMCPSMTKQCYKSCLGNTGRAELWQTIVKSRIARTKLYATDRATFWKILEPELHAVDRAAARLSVTVAFRPNVLSDQKWHETMPQMFEEFPHWQFYGYTKLRQQVIDKIDGKLPDNLHLTYSWSERADIKQVRYFLRNGVNTAVAFYDKKLLKARTPPDRWRRMEVIDGDVSDLRFLDPAGVAVGLKAKLPRERMNQIRTIKRSDGFFQGV